VKYQKLNGVKGTAMGRYVKLDEIKLVMVYEGYSHQYYDSK